MKKLKAVLNWISDQLATTFPWIFTIAGVSADQFINGFSSEGIFMLVMAHLGYFLTRISIAIEKLSEEK